MNDQKPPELFAERPIRSDFARARSGPPYVVRRFITLFVMCVIIGGGLYYWKNHRATPTAPEDIPTIKADGSYKQRPEQPGGIDIPHQDVQVYQSLDAKTPAKDQQVEHLLPPPETPQSNTVAPRPLVVVNDAPAPPENLTPQAAKLETTATQDAPAPQPQMTTAPAPVAAPTAPVAPAITTAVPPAAAASAPKPQAVVPQKTAPVAKLDQQNLDKVFKDVGAQPDAVATAAVTAPVANTSSAPAATGAGGNSAIQLASIPDQASAQAAMGKLQTQYASILSSTQLRLVKADLGAKGTYYRVQSEPISEARAKSLCTALKANKAGCILVRL
jgi:hypothetical protein